MLLLLLWSCLAAAAAAAVVQHCCCCCCCCCPSPEKYFHTKLSVKFFLLPTSTCNQHDNVTCYVPWHFWLLHALQQLCPAAPWLLAGGRHSRPSCMRLMEFLLQNLLITQLHVLFSLLC
jgi:hypothetical protein